MPTIFIINGFRFFFYSNENNEPPHVHIVKGSASGKVWLEPSIIIAYLHGFSNAEHKDILKIVTSNYESFIQYWYEYFG
jgi:hypothetical protein